LPSSLQSIIFYEGLSPIVNNSITVDVLFDLPTGGNVQAILEDDGTTGNTLSRVRSGPVAFEQTDFRNPTGSLVINGGDLTDDLLINALPDFDASLIVGGLTPFDQVTFAGAVTLAANQNLGVIAKTIDFNGASSDVALSGNGQAHLIAGQSIGMSAGSGLTTSDGDIFLVTNILGNTPGSFVGIDIDGATFQATGTGFINVAGTGGDSGADQFGIRVGSGGKILSGSGSIEVLGRGGISTGDNAQGVRVIGVGSQIGSTSGDVTVVGLGGGAGGSSNDYGVWLEDESEISTGGTGTVSVFGAGGFGTGNSQGGVHLERGASISAVDGAVTVNGEGGDSDGDQNYGVSALVLGTIESTGSGSVTVNGQGGSGDGSQNMGVFLDTGGRIRATGTGTVSVTGTGGVRDGGPQQRRLRQKQQLSRGAFHDYLRERQRDRSRPGGRDGELGHGRRRRRPEHRRNIRHRQYQQRWQRDRFGHRHRWRRQWRSELRGRCRRWRVVDSQLEWQRRGRDHRNRRGRHGIRQQRRRGTV
jgi:hypothetical protein